MKDDGDVCTWPNSECYCMKSENSDVAWSRCPAVDCEDKIKQDDDDRLLRLVLMSLSWSFLCVSLCVPP
jgi:hypothetical protein